MRTLLAAALLALTPAAASAAPAMWEVSDADSKVWLFGSMHALPEGVEWRTPLLDEKLATAELVYFEADIGPLGMVGILLKSLMLGFAGAEKPWTERLTPAENATITRAITPLGLKLSDLGAYPPWVAQTVIDDKVLRETGFDVERGADAVLQGELPKERKAYFESAGEQMDMMSAEGERAQIDRLLRDIANLRQLPSDLRALENAWSSGDVGGLIHEVETDPSIDAAFQQSMLVDRNFSWVSKIKELLAQNQQDLIIVGAAHLAGEQSVTAALEAAGFTVERIQ